MSTDWFDRREEVMMHMIWYESSKVPSFGIDLLPLVGPRRIQSKGYNSHPMGYKAGTC